MGRYSERSKEQQLIDICFEMVLAISDKRHAKKFSKKSNEEKADWVAEKLKNCGFETYQCGASWGVLKNV